MSWKEIKYAVNKSLGTAGFKPIDVKIDELEAKVIDYRIEPSDYILTETKNAQITSTRNSTKDIPYKFTFNTSGTVRLSASVKNSNSNYAESLDAYINGVIYPYDNNSETIRISDTSYVTKTADIVVNKGDVMTLKIKAGSGTGYIEANSLNLCGTLVNAAALGSIEMEEV